MADLTEERFDSKSVEYETPWELFNPLDKEFGFTVDACATFDNKKIDTFWSKRDDGLSQFWEGVIWCNPPYGREMPKWIKKAYESARMGQATTVMLIPARTNTSWWHNFCMKGEIRFIRGRPRFNNGKHGLPFPLALVIFRKN